MIIPQYSYNGNLVTRSNLLYNREYIHRQSQEASMRRIFGFLIGATLGGLIGGAAALLFAPASGQEVRAQINDRAQAFATEIRQAASTRRIELNERLEILRAPKA
jgi:hypothetical protein